ncbi:hypothetical protein GCM10027613_41460 [Microlunatus endophyticus]
MGTRNHVVIVGVTSRSGGFATELAKRLAERHPATDTFDGVVAVAHTEAGEDTRPNNADFVLAVLAGTLVHPNVGAVLLVDEPDAVLTSKDVNLFMQARHYPAVVAPCATFNRHGGFEADLAEAAEVVERWLPEVTSAVRTEQPLAELKIGLQCGGSDAFSGLSANPLAGAVGAEVIKSGGIACLAETDELIAAEGYVLKNVRSPDVARRFLAAVQSFKERVAWHGHTAEGNPSGGNIYRGLVNISLKSLGAARKLPREVRLDEVINYGDLYPRPGYIFMDSPGNDLESVAGQVASGSNLIFFTTGNGSITNFPFVPTMKFVTTSERYRLLSHEMDVNAGRYLDGEDFDALTSETFEQTIRVASGERTAGEQAGHSQVSIWRNWKQTGPRQGISITIDGRLSRRLDELPADESDALLPGLSLPVDQARLAALGEPPVRTVELFPAERDYASEQLALVLPTSLCSGQIAARLADRAQAEDWTAGRTTRAVALPHTEGCGVSGGANVVTFTRTLVGYLAHSDVRLALLLEHGCEKTHNDFFRHELVEAGLDPDRFGWASIQLDGGIEASGQRVKDWFADRALTLDVPDRVERSLADLFIALDARGPVSDVVGAAFGRIGGWIVRAGGTVVVPATSGLLANAGFKAAAGIDRREPTLAHGQRPKQAGWHIMRMPTTDWLETATGLGATGAQLALVHVIGGTLGGHRFLPVLQVSADQDTVAAHDADLDAILDPSVDDAAADGLRALVAAASGRIRPKADQSGNVGFQLTRGLLGASM